MAIGDRSRGSVPSTAQVFPVVLVRAGWKELTLPRVPLVPTGGFSLLTQSCSCDRCRGRATRGCGLAGGDDRCHRAALPKEVPRRSRAKPPPGFFLRCSARGGTEPSVAQPQKDPPVRPSSHRHSTRRGKDGAGGGTPEQRTALGARGQAAVVQIGCNGQQEEGTEVFVDLASCCRIEPRSAGAALPSSGRKKLLVLIKYLGFVFSPGREGRCVWEQCCT